MKPVATAVFVIWVMFLGGCRQEQTQPDTGARVRHWIDALGSPDAKVRKEAAFKLGNLGLTDPETVVTALTAALKDSDALVRCEVILALSKCGPRAKGANPTLTEVKEQDEDSRVRDYAAKALAKLNDGK